MSAAPDEDRVARRDRRREGRRQAILDAALRVLRQRGYDGFQLGAVAAEADLSKAALFYYFDSKEALLAELAGAVLREEMQVLHRAVESAPTGIDALVAVARAHFGFHRSDLARFRVIATAVPSLGLQPELLEGGLYAAAALVNDALEKRLVDEQRRGTLHPDANPRRLGNVAWLAAHGLLTLASTLEALGGRTLFTPDELLDEACDTLRRGALAK